MMRRALTLATAAALVAGLGGCITLFPKEAPAQLYRFEAATSPASAATAPAFTVRTGALDFDEPASGDQILTSNGDQVAYLAAARWAAPAMQLFDAAIFHGFDAGGGPAHLVGPGAAGNEELRLQMQVTRFEANYASGLTAPPTIVVRLHATLVHEKDLTPAGDRTFEASVPASDNHIAAIVTAYDAATTKVVGDLVAWVDQRGG
jgi:cholesterol transport system auxiliary component